MSSTTNTLKEIDLRNITVGVKEDKSTEPLTVNLFQNSSLISGSAGSGKSVVIKTILSQITKTNAVIYGIDFTQTEFHPFDDNFTSIAHNQDEALILLQSILEEFLRRTTYLKSIGAARLSIDDPEHPPIVVVINELADLLPVGNSTGDGKGKAEEIRKLVESIAQLSRSASISLIASTQSPKEEVVSKRLLNNSQNRISLFSATRNQLQAVLGEVALELELIKQGEHAGWFVGGNTPVKFKTQLDTGK